MKKILKQVYTIEFKKHAVKQVEMEKSIGLIAKEVGLVEQTFWGYLKPNLVHHRRFKTRKQAIQEITEYIEIFYNRQRKQEKLGSVTSTIYAAILCNSAYRLNR